MEEILSKIKVALRLKTDAYNDEITDLINAAISDLEITDIYDVDKKLTKEAKADPLLLQAVITYCKMYFGTVDPSDFERLKFAYDEQKAQLSMSGKYTHWEGRESGGTMIIDNTLSTTSENAVQNKVITAALQNVLSAVASNENAIAALNAEMQTAKTDIATLKTNVNEESAAIAAIESKVTDVENEIAALSENVAGVESDVEKINGDITTINGNVASVQEDLAGKQNKLTAGPNITIDENGVISAGGSENPFDFSVGEKVVGKWIDGKPLYRRAYSFYVEQSQPQTTFKYALGAKADLDIKQVIDDTLVNTYVRDDGVVVRKLCWVDANNQTRYQYTLYGIGDNVELQMAGSATMAGNMAYIIYYTKNAD